MLADSVEAALRVLEDLTPQKIEEVINHIVRTKLNAGQLDEAPMTLRQIDQVKQEFVRIISGMYHNRIDYPESSGGITATWQPKALAGAGGRAGPGLGPRPRARGAHAARRRGHAPAQPPRHGPAWSDRRPGVPAAAAGRGAAGRRVHLSGRRPALGRRPSTSHVSRSTKRPNEQRATSNVRRGRRARALDRAWHRSEEHTSELQSQSNLVCRLLLEKKKKKT